MTSSVQQDIEGCPTDKCLKALIVDDTNLERKINGKYLYLLTNCEIVEANNVNDAVDRFVSGETCDLVLLGKSRPIVDGIEATRKLKEIGGMVKIIAVSDEEYKDAFIAAGADGFLTKPMEPKALREVLKKFEFVA